MDKKWIKKEVPTSEKIKKLSEEINVSTSISSLLLQRGIENYNHAKDYFRPSLDGLYQPLKMLNMQNALSRLIQAIENKEEILLYGDYDVDGTTSISMMYDFIKKIYPNVQFYIPDRHIEGYGVSLKSIEWAAQNNFKLIISVDCGIKAIAAVTRAKELGIEFIICDHHEPSNELPPTENILNPKQKKCQYPFKELSGAGVGFKLLEAIVNYKNINKKELYQYLDLVAISIASDIVPITNENRILAYHGLEYLNGTAKVGLNCLLKISDLEYKKGDITISDIVFKIAPRINAAGRMGCAKKVVNLIIEQDLQKAQNIANEINQQNNLRKEIDKATTQEAFDLIESNEKFSISKTITLYNKKWHKGVIGIVAARCIEKYYKPTIILTHSNDKVTGSARSVEGYNLYNAINKCNSLLENYGGHSAAAGVTLKEENIELLKERFEEIVSAEISTQQLIPPQHIDLEIDFCHINTKMLKIICQMAPFGPGNNKPIFITKNIKALNYYVVKNEHLKLTLQQKETNIIFDAIAFGLGKHKLKIDKSNLFNIAYTIETNNYLNKERIQLNIKDIQHINYETPSK